MKILYHHRTLADGAEGVHIAEMVRAFRNLGHEVRVLGLAAGNREVDTRRWIARVRQMVPRVVFEAATVTANVLEYVQARQVIRQFRPDFVYKRHARSDVGVIYAARRAGRPLVLEVNCLFTGPGYRLFEPLTLERLAARLERRALRAATVRVAVSSPLARQIRDVAGVDALIVPNGVNPLQFDPARTSPELIRKRYGFGGGVVVGWIGVIREWHGLEILVDALAQLPGARLLIVGDGPARAWLETRAASLGLAERLTITGRVPHEDIPDHISAMDIAVVAGDRTGVASPMKLVEYMAMARAVVAPALPNIQDVITSPELGRLFRPDDAGELVGVLRALAGDSVQRRCLGDAARRAVVEHRTWHAIAARIIAALPGATGSGESV